MNATTEQISKFSLGNYEAALRIAQITLDSTERLVKFNLELSKQSLEDNARFARELSGCTDAQGASQRFKELAGEAVEKGVANARGYYELVSQTQGALTQLAEESMGEFNKRLISQIETPAKDAPARSHAAANALNTSIAATAATPNSLAHRAQEVVQFADSSVKNAAEVTAEAVKAGGKRSA